MVEWNCCVAAADGPPAYNPQTRKEKKSTQLLLFCWLPPPSKGRELIVDSAIQEEKKRKQLHSIKNFSVFSFISLVPFGWPLPLPSAPFRNPTLLRFLFSSSMN